MPRTRRSKVESSGKAATTSSRIRPEKLARALALHGFPEDACLKAIEEADGDIKVATVLLTKQFPAGTKSRASSTSEQASAAAKPDHPLIGVLESVGSRSGEEVVTKEELRSIGEAIGNARGLRLPSGALREGVLDRVTTRLRVLITRGQSLKGLFSKGGDSGKRRRKESDSDGEEVRERAELACEGAEVLLRVLAHAGADVGPADVDEEGAVRQVVSGLRSWLRGGVLAVYDESLAVPSDVSGGKEVGADGEVMVRGLVPRVAGLLGALAETTGDGGGRGASQGLRSLPSDVGEKAVALALDAAFTSAAACRELAAAGAAAAVAMVAVQPSLADAAMSDVLSGGVPRFASVSQKRSRSITVSLEPWGERVQVSLLSTLFLQLATAAVSSTDDIKHAEEEPRNVLRRACRHLVARTLGKEEGTDYKAVLATVTQDWLSLVPDPAFPAALAACEEMLATLCLVVAVATGRHPAGTALAASIARMGGPEHKKPEEEVAPRCLALLGSILKAIPALPKPPTRLPPYDPALSLADLRTRMAAFDLPGGSSSPEKQEEDQLSGGKDPNSSSSSSPEKEEEEEDEDEVFGTTDGPVRLQLLTCRQVLADALAVRRSGNVVGSMRWHLAVGACGGEGDPKRWLEQWTPSSVRAAGGVPPSATAVSCAIGTVVQESGLVTSGRTQGLKAMLAGAAASGVRIKEAAMRAIRDVTVGDPSLLEVGAVVRVVSEALAGGAKRVKAEAVGILGDHLRQTSSATLARFVPALLATLSDPGVSVRRAAVDIFAQVLQTDALQEDARVRSVVLLRLLRRLTNPLEDASLKKRIQDALETIWFAEPTPSVAHEILDLVQASLRPSSSAAAIGARAAGSTGSVAGLEAVGEAGLGGAGLELEWLHDMARHVVARAGGGGGPLLPLEDAAQIRKALKERPKTAQAAQRVRHQALQTLITSFADATATKTIPAIAALEVFSACDASLLLPHLQTARALLAESDERIQQRACALLALSLPALAVPDAAFLESVFNAAEDIFRASSFPAHIAAAVRLIAATVEASKRSPGIHPFRVDREDEEPEQEDLVEQRHKNEEEEEKEQMEEDNQKEDSPLRIVASDRTVRATTLLPRALGLLQMCFDHCVEARRTEQAVAETGVGGTLAVRAAWLEQFARANGGKVHRATAVSLFSMGLLCELVDFDGVGAEEITGVPMETPLDIDEARAGSRDDDEVHLQDDSLPRPPSSARLLPPNVVESVAWLYYQWLVVEEDASLRRQALRGFGALCARAPRLLLPAPATAVLRRALMANEAPVRQAALEALRTVLLSQEARARQTAREAVQPTTPSAASAAAADADEEELEEETAEERTHRAVLGDTDADGSIATGALQRLLVQVHECLFDPSPSVRALARQVEAEAIAQGSVGPEEAARPLIALLCTLPEQDTEAAAKLAHREREAAAALLAALHDKHPVVVEACDRDGIVDGYRFQRERFGRIDAVSAMVNVSSWTPAPFAQTALSAVQASAALVGPMYLLCKTRTPKVRDAFLRRLLGFFRSPSHLLSRRDDESPLGLGLLRFVAGTLATLPYDSEAAPLGVIFEITRRVVVRGEEVAQRLENAIELLQSSATSSSSSSSSASSTKKDSFKSPASDDTTFSIETPSPQRADSRRTAARAAADAASFLSLLSVASHLRKVYNLSDDQCRTYSPMNADSEKPVSRDPRNVAKFSTPAIPEWLEFPTNPDLPSASAMLEDLVPLFEHLRGALTGDAETLASVASASTPAPKSKSRRRPSSTSTSKKSKTPKAGTKRKRRRSKANDDDDDEPDFPSDAEASEDDLDWEQDQAKLAKQAAASSSRRRSSRAAASRARVSLQQLDDEDFE